MAPGNRQLTGVGEAIKSAKAVFEGRNVRLGCTAELVLARLLTTSTPIRAPSGREAGGAGGRREPPLPKGSPRVRPAAGVNWTPVCTCTCTPGRWQVGAGLPPGAVQGRAGPWPMAWGRCRPCPCPASPIKARVLFALPQRCLGGAVQLAAPRCARRAGGGCCWAGATTKPPTFSRLDGLASRPGCTICRHDAGSTGEYFRALGSAARRDGPHALPASRPPCNAINTCSVPHVLQAQRTVRLAGRPAAQPCLRPAVRLLRCSLALLDGVIAHLHCLNHVWHARLIGGRTCCVARRRPGQPWCWWRPRARRPARAAS